MQYILTEQEREALVSKSELELAKRAIDGLRVMVVPAGKCVHDDNGPEYCDDCPISDIGGMWKNEPRPTRDVSRTMCRLPRSYSK